MEISSFFKKIFHFIYKRVIELLALSLLFLAITLIFALFSYSATDPNFIFPDNTEISNWVGFRGSVVSDILLQSVGIISFLIPISYLFNSLIIFNEKKLKKLLDCTFFIILYSISGSLFFNLYFNNSFWLPINGHGGFVGEYLGKISLVESIRFKNNFLYYFLIFTTLFLFIISLNIKILYLKTLYIFFKKTFTFRKTIDDLGSRNINLEVSDKKNERSVQENFAFENIKITDRNFKNKVFNLPDINFLSKADKNKKNIISEREIDEDFLEKILLDFGVEGKIKKISQGPVVTLNEFEPAPGIKVSKIINLSEDIARNTSSESARISTIPGSSTIGIELPNLSRENVYLSEIISSQNFYSKNIKLPIALGKSISGLPLTGDLSIMPHLLIAGTTGSGKSVCINTIILSLLYKHTPEKCKFILIDPKMLELSTYEGIPHLLCPVITEAKRAASVLGWVVKEMESRYRLMTKEGVRNIDGYNSKHKLPMPYIVVIVDEMSDLMLVAGKEIEGYIQKLSQMARAAGIHIIMATQRPSVDVITGTIKANFPTRISFQVTSKIDSRTILGEQGAEQLLGKGDMLYMSSANKIIRIHAPYVSENEIEKINNYLRNQAEPNYVDEILNFADEKENQSINQNVEGKDDLYDTALEIVKTEGKASTSFLQRKLQIGYNRAARIIDMMEENGEVSKANHVGKREVLK
jgi:S-DNA-T family DNA segregation ATPase FtsK/SpoIIIE|tara:strand:- start:3619 stop:5709 length:2091 start_codon:yes stop_codon:yes gene_type:complete